MRTFTLVTRSNLEPLPQSLALLDAPVRTKEPSAPDEYVGRTGGVLLDEDGSVVAFLVQLTRDLAAKKYPWTLVPTSAIAVTRDSTIHVDWTEDQLLAQPRFDANFDAHALVDGEAPVESQWMPARPNVVPPGTGVSGAAAVNEGAAGGAIGAVIGAVAGFALGGPLAAAALGTFFAAGGSLAGLISGGSRETAAEASELKLETEVPRLRPADPRLEPLARALRDATSLGPALRVSQFELVVTGEQPKPEARRRAS